MNYKEDDNYFEEIQPNIWLMDNHKWALYCWELFRKRTANIPSTLVHLDYHWDAVNDYYEDDEEIKNATIKDIKSIATEENYIRLDSFIAPSIIREYVNRVDFHCYQTDTEIGLDDCLLKKYNCKQNIYENINDLVKSIENEEIILDIDLDIFNRSDNFFQDDL